MALPLNLQNTFSPNELQFITENGQIEVLPRYSISSMSLITTTIPKLTAMQRVSIPIWLAIILKQQQKCSIIPPAWFTLPKLKEFYAHEVNELNSFSELPSNWLEISKLFFDYASDDLSDEVHKYRSLIQDLKEIRNIKVKKGVGLVNESNLQLDNLSMVEINELRPFLVSVMKKLGDLDAAARGSQEGEVHDDKDAAMGLDDDDHQAVGY